MTDALRDRLAAAIGAALDASPYWLPADGRPALTDAAHAVVTAPGYCPHCGRGDVAPTADEYEQQRQRAEKAEAERDALKRAHIALAEQAGKDQAALAALHEGEEPSPDPHIEPTPGQWLWKWNRATPEQRLDMIGRIQQAFADQSACFMGAHRAQVENARRDGAAVGRIDAERLRRALGLTPNDT